jgi:type II restriction enzyme
MLNDEHFKVLKYEKNSRAVFPSNEINGGVAITYRDSNKQYTPIVSFTIDDNISNIRDKVLSNNEFKTIKGIIYLQNKFNLDELYKDHPLAKEHISSNGNEKRIVSSAFDNLEDVFSDNEPQEEFVKICGLISRRRVYKYIPKRYLEEGSNIDKYKVVLSAADGASGTIGNPLPARIIGKPFVEDKNVGYSQTFISIGEFENKNEAENLYKYLLTKFARFMVGTLKATNGLKIEVWSNVPLQDFSENSDIDWKKSIHEIDEQLYKKYNLTQEEINFIETHVKEME